MSDNVLFMWDKVAIPYYATALHQHSIPSRNTAGSEARYLNYLTSHVT